MLVGLPDPLARTTVDTAVDLAILDPSRDLITGLAKVSGHGHGAGLGRLGRRFGLPMRHELLLFCQQRRARASGDRARDLLVRQRVEERPACRAQVLRRWTIRGKGFQLGRRCPSPGSGATRAIASPFDIGHAARFLLAGLAHAFGRGISVGRPLSETERLGGKLEPGSRAPGHTAREGLGTQPICECECSCGHRKFRIVATTLRQGKQQFRCSALICAGQKIDVSG